VLVRAGNPLHHRDDYPWCASARGCACGCTCTPAVRQPACGILYMQLAHVQRPLSGRFAFRWPTRINPSCQIDWHQPRISRDLKAHMLDHTKQTDLHTSSYKLRYGWKVSVSTACLATWCNPGTPHRMNMAQQSHVSMWNSWKGLHAP